MDNTLRNLLVTVHSMSIDMCVEKGVPQIGSRPISYRVLFVDLIIHCLLLLFMDENLSHPFLL